MELHRRKLLSAAAALSLTAITATACITDARDDEFATTEGELRLTKKYSREDLFSRSPGKAGARSLPSRQSS
jgi:hypothetical protein